MKYNIFVKDKGISKPCNESKHLMDGLYIYESLVPTACHNGACGLCKVKIYKGDFEKLKMDRKHISEDEENNNIVLACKVFPRSDMEIEFVAELAENEKTDVYVFGK